MDKTGTIAVAAGPMTAKVLAESGPRIISLEVDRLGELLAKTAVSVKGPLGKVPLIGGHRLWSAPEQRAITYVPDTSVRVDQISNGVQITTNDPRLMIEKRMSVRSAGDSLVIDHLLTNRTAEPVEAAAWAITMIRSGGIAVIPAPAKGLDEDGFQARSAVVLWPYTNLDDPRLDVANDGVRVTVEGTATIKVGMPNLCGWTAYLIGGLAFVKWTRRHDLRLRYADLGASAQIFVGHGFGELETLGPLTELESGSSLAHREIWHVYELAPGLPEIEALDNLNLPELHPLLGLDP